jgi:hypothetical protein
VVFVANNIGSSKLVARMTTDSRYRINGISSLSDWWNKATGAQRLLALTTSKDFANPSKSDAARMSQVQFPFSEAELGAFADQDSGTDS